MSELDAGRIAKRLGPQAVICRLQAHGDRNP